MKKNIKTIIGVCIAILIIALLVIIKQIGEAMQIIPENDPYIVGNTAGNLYNGGYYAEQDGRVYFANAYDGYQLYSMNSDQTDIRLVAGGYNSYINISGNYVYYYSSTTGNQTGLGYVMDGRGLFRTSLDGKRTVSLSRITSDGMMLVGSNLYYTAFYENPSDPNAALVTLDTVTINNENMSTLMSEHIKLGGYSNGRIIYSGVTGDHHIYAFSVDDGSISTLSANVNAYLPIIVADKIYYLDLDRNYHLCVLSLSDGTVTELVSERIDTYNLYGNVVFYQTCNPDNYELRRLNLDLMNDELIASGVFCKINCTSTYTYFEAFGNQTPVYMVPTFGGSGISTFDAALSAVINKQ